MKNVFLLFISIYITTMAWAAPAWRKPISALQSDGTTLTFLLNGDEHFNWRSTLDGALLVSMNNNHYVAIVNQDGSLTASTVLAHNAEQRSRKEQMLIDQQDKNLFFSVMNSTKNHHTRALEPVKMTSSIFPHTGSPKAIVILVEFSDLAFTVKNPKVTFDEYLNLDTNQCPPARGNYQERNYRSVKQYFKDMSFGAFSPQFDVYGPVKTSQTMAYYGQGADGIDEKYQELTQEAITLIKDSIKNFSDYDFNNDNIIDLVYLIYAGYGESYGAPSNTLWPKSYSHSYDIGNGFKTGRCGISNELIGSGPITQNGTVIPAPICGIGLFVHEFSHCLGLPDFYPTSGTSTWTFADLDNQGMENWSIMDNGIYTDLGFRPVAYTAWEREALGWMSIPKLTSAQKVNLKDIDIAGKNDNIAYRIMNDANTTGNEYYIVQNIQDTLWNTHLGGHGMIMYHVNYDSYSFNVASNSPNNTKDAPRMTVIAADKTLVSSYRVNQSTNQGGITLAQFNAELAGDPFPGTSNITTINDTMGFINYAPWTGGVLNKPIFNITENNRVITFDYLEDFTTNGIENHFDESVLTNTAIYSIDGRYMGTNKTALPKGIYIINKKKYVVR